MGSGEIEVQIEGKDELLSALDPEHAFKLKVEKDADPCPRCARNEDPTKVPLHKNCHCRVVVVAA